MAEDFYGFHTTDAAIQDGAVAAASVFGANFTQWTRRYAFELEALFEIGGPNHFGKAKRNIAWLGEQIFKCDAPAFDPDMSFDDVIETYCRGQVIGGLGDHLRDLLDYHSEDDEDATFPAPWIDADMIDGYRIESTITADDLCYEGERMHNCVANYVSDVTSGEAFFYHVSKDGERVATLQLTQTTNRYIIEEIRGICNADVSGVVSMAVRHWMAKKAR